MPRLLRSFFILAMLLSCKQSPIVNTDNPATTLNVDSLIKKRSNYESSHSDSLFLVANQLLHIAKTANNKKALVYGEMFTANYYWLSANHKKSMEVAVRCLADAEKWNIKSAYPELYLIIANLHKENSNYNMAFAAQEKGLNWAIVNRDTGYIISLLGLKAMFIHTWGSHSHDATYKDTSIKIQLATLKLAESNAKYERWRIPLYDNISQYYLNNKDYEKAIYYGDKGAQTALKYNLLRSLTYSYSWLGQAYYFKGNKQKGLEYLNKALLLTRTLKEPYREMELYEHLYECYYSSADYKTAISLNLKARNMRDSLQVTVNEKHISELQIKYESAKKDKEIAEMDRVGRIKNRQILFILAGSLLFVIFSIVLFLQYRILYRSNRIIKKSNIKKNKALENIAHIQAHELRKPLASIMGLVNLIKATDYEVDRESLAKLEEASKQLDTKIRSIIGHVEADNK
jgi:tetratricopeptide (TPR) repeat protein